MFGRKWKKIAQERLATADRYKEILDECASNLNKSPYRDVACHQPSDVPLLILGIIRDHECVRTKLDDIAEEQRIKFHSINHNQMIMRRKIKEVLDEHDNIIAFTEADVT